MSTPHLYDQPIDDGKVRDKDGNVRQAHSHRYYAFESPFGLAAPDYTDEECDDFECFGDLPGGNRDIREVPQG